jgi:octaprenyl-diphosphate synthase
MFTDLVFESDTINEVARYLLDVPGKRIRPLLTIYSYTLCTGETPSDAVLCLASAVELIHTATLFHDDVIDNAPTRRSKKATHHVFGNTMTILVGDFLFAQAFELMVKTNSLKVLELLSKASKRITEGEILQFKKGYDFSLTYHDYVKIIDYKTAALFSAAMESSAILAQSSKQEVLRLMGYHLGMAFQMRDDILDYMGENTGKNIGTDLREKKVTLPSLLGYQKDPSFWEKCFEESNLESAVSFLTHHHIIDECELLCALHEKKLMDLIDTFEKTPHLDEFKDWVKVILSRST